MQNRPVGLQFRIEKKLQNALGRAGVLETPHGAIETPAFVAVGTKATVKALTPEQIKETGAQAVLGNTYHLYLEPGEKTVAEAGGLGAFMGWEGPTMTDSGGFQVFSLGAAFGRRTSKVSHGTDGKVQPRQGEVEPCQEFRQTPAAVDEGGVTFRSPKDGSTHRFTPERSIEIQHALGADIIFAFDECTSPDAPYAYQKGAMERTHIWAARCLARHREFRVSVSQGRSFFRPQGPSLGKAQALFGIVQGGRHEDLRRESARAIGAMPFDGFGIGGSFDKNDIDSVVGLVNRLLPEEKPRHLLGIGEPEDLFAAVENGCDLFDCVAPTRNARNGTFYTKQGKVNIENARFKNDFSPIESGCRCYTCLPREEGGGGFSRAYLAHLFRSGEILANTLATIHNLHFIVHLVKNIRQSIFDVTFSTYRDDFLAKNQDKSI